MIHKSLFKAHRIFFYLLVVFLPTQLGLHFWPDWAMVLGRRVDYLSPTIHLTDIFVLLMLISWLIPLLSSSGLTRGSIKTLDSRVRGNDKKTIYGIFFIFFILANIFLAASPAVAFYIWLKVLEFSLLCLYIIRTKPSLLTTSYCLLAAIFYSSLIAIFQFMFQHSLGGFFWWLGERTFSASTPGISQINLGKLLLRAYGTFPHPNVMAGFLVAVLPLVATINELRIHTNIRIQKRIFQILKWTIVGLGIIAFALTFSRSAIVVGLLALAASSWKLVVRKKQNIFFFLIFLLATSYFLLTTFSPSEESFVVREQLNQSAVKLFFQSPVVGIGLGNFLVKLPDVLVSRQIYFLQPVHNIYLLVLSEAGIVGLILFLFLVWKAIRKFSAYRLSLLVLLVLGFVDHYLLTLQQGQLLFTLLLAFSFTHPLMLQLAHEEKGGSKHNKSASR